MWFPLLDNIKEKNTFHGCFLQALVFKKAGRLRGERKGQQILVNWYC
jgi:hypothetical protein